MGAVTVLAMHRAWPSAIATTGGSSDEFQTTESGSTCRAQERQRAESFLYFHRMALAEREWSANNIDRVDRLLEDCPPRPARLGMALPEAAMPSRPDLRGTRLSVTRVMDGHLRSV